MGGSMQLVTQPGQVSSIDAGQLQQYQAAHHESEYAIVDVRQPEEYRLGHIPGARLMPLGDLATYAEELRKIAGRTVVFYCRSGGRSSRASAWAAGELGLPK